MSGVLWGLAAVAAFLCLPIMVGFYIWYVSCLVDVFLEWRDKRNGSKP